MYYYGNSTTGAIVDPRDRIRLMNILADLRRTRWFGHDDFWGEAIRADFYRMRR